jgi:hypothetical protein
MHGDWALLGVDVVAAAVLINAGLVKIASPAQLRAALNELLGGGAEVAAGAGSVSARAVRVAAVIEVAVGVALLAPALRVVAAAGVAGLGACFVALGVAGRLRRSVQPCGCAGEHGGRPLGWTNVGMGLALVAVLPVNLAIEPPDPAVGSAGFGTVASALTALLLLIAALWTNRALAASLVRPAAGAAAARQNGAA